MSEREQVKKTVQVNEDCLQHIFNYLSFKDRMQAMQVSKLWRSVALRFSELNATDFIIPADRLVKKCASIQENANFKLCIFKPKYSKQQVFYWAAFTDLLYKSEKSIRRLDLSVLNKEQFNVIVSHINIETCCAVECLVVPCHGRRRKQPDQEMELTPEDLAVQPLAELCTPGRLPRLRWLVLHDAEAMNNQTVRAITRDLAPRLHRMDFNGSESTCHGHVADDKTWEEFFHTLPPTLEHLSVNCGIFVNHLLNLLRARPNLPALHSLSVGRLDLSPPNLSTNIRHMDGICELLAPQLQQLKVCTGRLATGQLCYLAHLKNLRALRITGVIDWGKSDFIFQHIGEVMSEMKHLQVFDFFVVKLEGGFVEMLPCLSRLTQLREFSVVWSYVNEDVVDVISESMPNLRRLVLLPYSTLCSLLDRGGDSLSEIRPAFIRLVGRLHKLEYLDLQPMFSGVYSMEILTEMETVLSQTRVPPGCSHVVTERSEQLPVDPPRTLQCGCPPDLVLPLQVVLRSELYSFCAEDQLLLRDQEKYATELFEKSNFLTLSVLPLQEQRDWLEW